MNYRIKTSKSYFVCGETRFSNDKRTKKKKLAQHGPLLLKNDIPLQQTPLFLTLTRQCTLQISLDFANETHVVGELGALEPSGYLSQNSSRQDKQVPY